MDPFAINIVAGLSILVPALLVIIRWRRIPSLFYPFVVLLWVGAINEVISLTLIKTAGSNHINSNIYVLVEFLIIIIQFKVWQQWKNRTVYILIALGIAIWALDNLVLHPLGGNNSLFRMIYSGVVMSMSIQTLSQRLITQRGPLLKNPVILICVAFILFYMIKAYCESFNVFLPNAKISFYYHLWLILSIISLISNILYTLSILCMTPKIRFTLPY